ncbi:hypothetical protein F7R21_20325 [Burkholderia latens]|uniref:Uncharacterized protein n=1 Tax=Burkholderia latens TaxID=488446 RepID=A0A6H9TJB4_9BURK|nr:hypothetical protein F7R21_20325 [Burkholderia latens]
MSVALVHSAAACGRRSLLPGFERAKDGGRRAATLFAHAAHPRVLRDSRKPPLLHHNDKDDHHGPAEQAVRKETA